jgi:hypothetical protein
MQPAKDTFQIKEETEARMSPTDIILRPFGEITYSIVQKNTLQAADIGKISYIDKDLNSTLDEMVMENNIMMTMGIDPNKFRDFSNHGVRTPNLDWEAVIRDYTAGQERERAEAIGLDEDMFYEEPQTPYAKGYNSTHANTVAEPSPERSKPLTVETKNEDLADTGIRIDIQQKKPKPTVTIDDDIDDLI